MEKIGLDKVLHFVVCLVIAVVVMMLMYYFVPNRTVAQITGFAVAMSVGVAKEIADASTTGFDLKDLGADFAGALLAVMFGFGM